MQPKNFCILIQYLFRFSFDFLTSTTPNTHHSYTRTSLLLCTTLTFNKHDSHYRHTRLSLSTHQPTQYSACR